MDGLVHPDWHSQTGQRYTFTERGSDYDAFDNASQSMQRSTPPPVDSQAATQLDDLTVFVDRLANNYQLDPQHRAELHSFLDFARSMPTLDLKVALIQQAISFHNQQLLVETKTLSLKIQEGLAAVMKAVTVNATLTQNHKNEVTAVCKAQMYNGRRIDFDNEPLRTDVVPYLQKKVETNGLGVFFQGNKASKVLVVQVGRSLSYVKTFLRRAILQSLPDKNGNSGMGVTTLTTTLAKKCLGGSENAKPKHGIWCLIIRSFIRNNTELRIVAVTEVAAAAAAAATEDGNDDDELPESILPAKRTHNGRIIIQTNDGKILDAFWRLVTSMWKEKNKAFGSSDLKSAKWNDYINQCVKEERALFPSDALTLVLGSGSATPAAASSSNSRLSGLSRSVTADPGVSSHPPLTPHHSNIAFSAARGAGHSSLDQLINTPTEFVLGTPRNGGPSSSAFQLAPLNLSSHRRTDSSSRGAPTWH